MSTKLRPIAAIHNSFYIKRDLSETREGPITIEEQIKALERFVRWHERQVQVGKTLLGQLLQEQEQTPATATP